MNMMKLDEFISQTLTDIVTGIASAQERIKGTNAAINPPGTRAQGTTIITLERRAAQSFEPDRLGQMVEFDVAISTQQETKAEGKAGIFVVPFSIGSSLEGGSMNNTVSRIKFQIPVFMPEKYASKM